MRLWRPRERCRIPDPPRNLTHAYHAVGPGCDIARTASMASPDQPQVTEAILSILGKGSKALPAGSSLGVQRCAMAHEGADMPLALGARKRWDSTCRPHPRNELGTCQLLDSCFPIYIHAIAGVLSDPTPDRTHETMLSHMTSDMWRQGTSGDVSSDPCDDAVTHLTIDLSDDYQPG